MRASGGSPGGVWVRHPGATWPCQTHPSGATANPTSSSCEPWSSRKRTGTYSRGTDGRAGFDGTKRPTSPVSSTIGRHHKSRPPRGRSQRLRLRGKGGVEMNEFEIGARPGRTIDARQGSCGTGHDHPRRRPVLDRQVRQIQEAEDLQQAVLLSGCGCHRRANSASRASDRSPFPFGCARGEDRTPPRRGLDRGDRRCRHPRSGREVGQRNDARW